MENAALFMNKLAEDKEMQEKLVAAAETAVTKEERIAVTTKFANEAGFQVSAEELQKFVKSAQNASNLLSDDDLDQVAGGTNWYEVAGAAGGSAAGTAAGGAIGNAPGAAAGGVFGAAAGGEAGKKYGPTAGHATEHAAKSAYHSVSHAVSKVFHSW